MGKQNIQPSSRRKKAEALLKNQQFDQARDLFQQICKLDSHDAGAWFMLGLTNAKLGNLDQAVECYQRAAAIRPDFWQAHYNLGKTLHDLGHLDEAEASYNKTVGLNPGVPQAFNNLGILLQMRGRLIEALACYRSALRYKPDFYTAHINIGSILHQMGRDREAETSYLQALKINSTEPVALKNLAATQLYLGKYDSALHNWQQLERLYPGQTDIPVFKAKILERQGQFDKAYNIIEPLIDQGKENADIALIFASLCHHVGRCNEAIAMLERVLSVDDKNHNDGDRPALYFRLGELYDARQDYDQAFKHFQTANDLIPIKYDSDAFTASVKKLIEAFDSQNLSNLPRGSNHSERPVFIVGMPRSGTTLVEQILASHPEVYGAGELDHIRLAIDDLPRTGELQKPYPDCLVELTQETYDHIAQSYLDHLKQLSTRERYVIDKMPGNFLHLGFIALLFPKAHIIHCMREPLDTCLSCYFSDFKGAHSYAYRLEDLGHYYRNYERLMQHWNAVLDIPILNVSYEALIADQEGMTRRLLDFLALEWDDACLRFHENKRFVNTLSYSQVRQPINTRSIGRWKHYERYLEPLKASLLDAMPERN